MSIIYCSTKVSALIGNSRLNESKSEQLADPLYAWNAQLFYLGRKKCIIVTNKATLYSFVRLNVLKRDLSDLSGFFTNSLLGQLEADGLYDSHEFWRPFFSKLCLYKTDNDKRVIGSINELIFQLKVGIAYNSRGLAAPTDTTAASYLNDAIMGLIKYSTPKEVLRTRRNNA
jgi:hypothetical protein